MGSLARVWYAASAANVHGMLHTLIGIIFAGLGAGVLAWSVWNLIKTAASRNWMTTQGVIVASDLRRSRDSEGGFLYRPEVSYRYTVDGSELVSARTRFGDRMSLSWSGPALKLVRRYAVGATVIVHYDPDDPGEAVLEPGVTGYILSGLFFGFVFALIGTLSIVNGA